MGTESLQIETSSLHSILASLGQASIHFAFKIVAALIIFSVGMWISARLTKIVKRGMERRKLEPSLQSFLQSFVSIISKVFVIVIVLTTVGVQMTAITAALGAGALAIGMALSGTMQNVAGGIIILFFKPFKVGDSIQTDSGNIGVVKKIMIFTTELHTFDNQVIFLPNGGLANGVITNLSNGALRRMDFTVGISYGDKVADARAAILKILKADKRVLNDDKHPASVFVSDLADSSVVLNVRYWTKYDDMYPTRADVIEQIYNVLPTKNVHFPFPQMDVHMIK